MSPTDGEQPTRGAAHGGPEEGRSDPEKDERFGELSLTRLEKDDGRSLILYAHPEQPEK